MSSPSHGNREAMDAEKSIEFHGVSFRLADGKTLLSGLNLEISRGETLVLLGRSGSGKTTTMKLINRLLDPTDGEVRVESRSTFDWDPIQLRRRIGYVIQEIGLFPPSHRGRKYLRRAAPGRLGQRAHQGSRP